ncbi:MAG TPA: STAS/SEC14 domain-containing protein, partial [Anaerolineales bacterium]|nr:STAS/SEC14 domain-containing protein [Anaerolineales bacterium]
PRDSVLVLSDFRDTSVGSDLLSSMNAASAATKSYVRRTAVLGVRGMKRKLADLLTALTGQPLKYFDDIESAKDWLAQE